MKLTILGSGTYEPHLKRIKPGYVISVGKENIIVDTGSGTFDQLYRAGFDYRKINYIFITHTHIDHMSDLLVYVQACAVDYNLGGKKRKTLNIIGPKGFKEFYDKFCVVFKDFKNNKFIKVHEMSDNDIKKLSFVSVESKLMEHATDKNTLSYKFKSKTKSVVVSGDTGYCDSIVELSKNVDLLLIEASLPYKFKGHLMPVESGKIAKEANVKKLVLTHFFKAVEKIDIKKEATKHFKGEIVLAKDLMEITI